MPTVKQKIQLSACAAAVAFMLSACGGGDLATDKTPPTATIVAAASGSNVSFTFTFSEDVGTSFTAEDVALSGGTAGMLTKVDATTYTLLVTPTGTAAVSASVAASKFTDLANNANTATATATFTPAAAFAGIDFSSASVMLEAFEGLVSTSVENDPTNAANKAVKFVKGPAGQPWAGATVYTVAADKSVGAIDFTGSKLVTMRVYSPAPGKKIMLKFENAADATKNMEVEATSLTTKTNEWETLTFDVSSKVNAAVTYNKISIFPNFLVAEATNTTYYFDDLAFKTASSAGTGTASTGIDFSGSTVMLEAFEGLVAATIENDPTSAANKVAKFIKGPAGQPWAGATVYTVAADKSVGAIDFTGSKLVTMRVYSPAPGKKIMLKFENAADATKNMEVEATSLTTKTNEWETLTFDVSSKVNAAVTYNKISIFPNFLVAEATNTTYYFDDIVYKTVTATADGGNTTTPVAGGKIALVNGVYASNYTEKPTPWQSVEGGTAGRYVDDSVGAADWWSGLAASDATPSFYFGYGLPAAPTKAWGFGAYVKAPQNGYADISSYKNIVISVWGNDELVNTKPKFTVLLKGAPVNGCTPDAKGEIAVVAAGVQTYTLALSSFALNTACGFGTVPLALAGGVGEVHIQVLGTNVQYVKTTDTGGKYPNGMNVGPIKFN